MPEVVAIEWVIGIAIGGLVVGLLAGYGASLRGGARSKVNELQTALDSAETELADYKREVFGQFAETAEKFRALDKSYNDLHRQLATSSVALCGDAATPLLAGPGTEAVLEEKAVTDDAVTDEALAQEKETVPGADGSTEEAQEAGADQPLVAATETPTGEVAPEVSTAEPAAANADDVKPAEDDIVVAERQQEKQQETQDSAETRETADAAQEDVPVLTDTEAPRRESA